MSRAAIRYAKAVLSLAQDKNATENIQQDMLSIIDTINASAELRMLLNSPLIKSEIKLASLLEIFKSTSADTQKLFDVLIQNKRVDLLLDVANQYTVLFDQLNKTQVAKVTTAVPLDETLSAKVLSKVKELTGNKATIENTIDESIIGGFILRVGDLQYNASIANKLTNLRRELSN
ncbi:ATP synthase F1 subunit delta [Aquimarina muelleri]|uniref:ATP synthase subunit delta n=1 Tax=Aquimarina muelleri TaxID=279356 RepID=A0A918N4V9_9FLAO|nr:ATP synthase F1 subunit delta [Aquimarina muelleri]MCX2764315.1 ATP synthase F1 subunit delta [Aquimarina muelleri]GGX32006.1 ATP synthase subunit delta [Aquimarina muelleri]